MKDNMLIKKCIAAIMAFLIVLLLIFSIMIGSFRDKAESADIKNGRTQVEGVAAESKGIGEKGTETVTVMGPPLVIEQNEAVEEESEEETDADSAGEYILPESNSRYLTIEEIEILTDEELKLVRNELYARHGRIFDGEDMAEYFSSKSWYQPMYTAEEIDSQGDELFNEYELANRALIVEEEERRKNML